MKRLTQILLLTLIGLMCACNKENKLVVAVQQGDVEQVRALLKGKSHRTHIRDNYKNRTLLHIAVEKQRPQIVKSLLDHGANVNVVDSEGDMPLWEAAQLGNPEIVQMLLESGADPNMTPVNDKKGTPFEVAGENGNAEAMELLLQFKAKVKANHFNTNNLITMAEAGRDDIVSIYIKAGYDVNATAGGQTCPAIWHAAARDRDEVVRVLLEAGADPGTTCQQQSLLDIAVEGENEQLQYIIFEFLHGRGKTSEKRFSLQWKIKDAVEHGWEGTLAELLRKPGAIAGLETVAIASRNGDLNSLKLLLKNQGKADDFLDGKTALMHASISPIRGTLDCMRHLLGPDIKANPNLFDDDNKTALVLLAEHAFPGKNDENERLEKTRLLLQYKADPNLSDNEGWTPLMYAVVLDNRELASLLMDFGADPDVENETGQNSLSLARDHGNVQTLKLLLEKSAAQN